MAKKEIDGVVVEASSILTALKIIRTVCADNSSCFTCPLSCGTTCLVHNANPSKWNIHDGEEQWRALLP